MTPKELRENRAELIAQGRAVFNAAETDKRGLTAEDHEQVNKIHAEAAELGKQIEAVENQQKAEAELVAQQGRDNAALLQQQEAAENHLNEIQPAHQPLAQAAGSAIPSGMPRQSAADPRQVENIEEQRTLAFSGWALRQADLNESITNDHRQAMQRFNLSPEAGTLNLELPTFYDDAAIEPVAGTRIDQILNALSVASDTAGGFTVPMGFVKSLEVALMQFGGIRNVATIMRTSTGEPLPHPTTNDTNNSGELIPENAVNATDGTDVAFSSKTLNAYDYSSKFVRVSHQLMRDSAFNIPALLGRLLGERLGRIQSTDCTTGNGAARPKGIIPSAKLGKTAASATAIAADEILQFIHSIDPAYRVGAKFMMHDNIFLAVSLLKDGNGNYLMQDGLTKGAPQRLRGYPIQISQDMASTVQASAKTMLFGQLSKYIIREVGKIRLERLRERFAEYNQIAFIGFMSFDGVLLDAGTNPVKHYQMAN